MGRCVFACPVVSIDSLPGTRSRVNSRGFSWAEATGTLAGVLGTGNQGLRTSFDLFLGPTKPLLTNPYFGFFQFLYVIL